MGILWSISLLVRNFAVLALLLILVVDVFYWPPVRTVWPNHEVVEFQPQSVNNTDLGSVAYCYEDIITTPPVCPSHRKTYLQWRVLLLPFLPILPVAPPHRIIWPPWRPLSLHQHTNPTLSIHGVLRSTDWRLSPIPLTRFLPSLDVVCNCRSPSRHAFRIPVAYSHIRLKKSTFLTFGRVVCVSYYFGAKLELGVLEFRFNGSLNSYLS